MNTCANTPFNSLRRAAYAHLVGRFPLNFSCATNIYRGIAFGGLGKVLDRLPTRETWFCLYQPQVGRTAYLYEYDEPINNQIYVYQVAPELSKHFGRPARECYIHAIHGESFTNCDAAQPPWYCYRLRLSGVRLGQRLGPYAPDDVVAPNRAALPLQGRWRNNVRDVHDLLDLLANPTEARLNTALHQLLAAAHQDNWRGGALLVQLLLVQRWGHEALERHGITAEVLRRAYDLYGDRMRQDGDGDGEAGRDRIAAAERRRAERRRRRLAAVSGGDPKGALADVGEGTGLTAAAEIGEEEEDLGRGISAGGGGEESNVREAGGGAWP